jgi:hypothetical protein
MLERLCVSGRRSGCRLDRVQREDLELEKKTDEYICMFKLWQVQNQYIGHQEDTYFLDPRRRTKPSTDGMKTGDR